MKVLTFLQASTLLAATLFTGGNAYAGSIYTPSIFASGGNQVVCTAVNVAGADLSVTVTIIGLTGNATETCTIGPTDAGGCQAFRNNDAGYCRITVAGLNNAQVAARIRGTFFSRRTTSPFTIFTQVDAR